MLILFIGFVVDIFPHKNLDLALGCMSGAFHDIKDTILFKASTLCASKDSGISICLNRISYPTNTATDHSFSAILPHAH